MSYYFNKNTYIYPSTSLPQDFNVYPPIDPMSAAMGARMGGEGDYTWGRNIEQLDPMAGPSTNVWVPEDYGYGKHHDNRLVDWWLTNCSQGW
jgi:hypothetical protein